MNYTDGRMNSGMNTNILNRTEQKTELTLTTGLSLTPQALIHHTSRAVAMAAADAGTMDVDGVRIHAHTYPSFMVHLGFGQLAAHWRLLHHAETLFEGRVCAAFQEKKLILQFLAQLVCVGVFGLLGRVWLQRPSPPEVVKCQTSS